MTRSFEVDGIIYTPPQPSGVPRMGSQSKFCSGEDGGDHSDHLYQGQAFRYVFDELNEMFDKNDHALRDIYGVKNA